MDEMFVLILQPLSPAEQRAIDLTLLDLIARGEMHSLYDPVRRDLVLMPAGQHYDPSRDHTVCWN
jgi:hypothetical protein